MTAIKLLSETKETVTLKRADFETLLRAGEDFSGSLAAVDAHRAYEDRVGWETARRNYLTAEEARRLLDGEISVRVWREKRGISQRALAEAAEVSPSYLAEIEGGKKPGGSGALQRIGRILDVPMENLTGTEISETGPGPISQADVAVERMVRLATTGCGRNQLGVEALAIASEWSTSMKHIGAALQALTSASEIFRRTGGASRSNWIGMAKRGPRRAKETNSTRCKARSTCCGRNIGSDEASRGRWADTGAYRELAAIRMEIEVENHVLSVTAHRLSRATTFAKFQ